ncbi:MAG TPA: ABC transporter permease [Spirochaetia bacterium]|nr:ABC transporter permease [Spirochaetia bacterium]
MWTLLRYVKIYFLIEAQYIKARMQYRLDFVMSLIGMFFLNVTTIFVFWVLFTTIPELAGYSFDEIIFIYGFYSLAIVPLQLFFDNIWQLRSHILEGTFIKYYLRPLNIMFYYMSEMVDLKAISHLLLGISALVYSSVHMGLVWDLPRILLLAAALFGASLVAISIMVVAASSAFWLVNSFSLVALALRLRDFSPYPLTIFDGFFRFIFTYLIPIGFVAFYPAQLFLKPSESSLLIHLSPLVGIATFALAYLVWRAGVNRCTGTGS